MSRTPRKGLTCGRGSGIERGLQTTERPQVGPLEAHGRSI